MKAVVNLALVTFGAVALTTSGAAARKITFTLNWVAGGDHAPYFYAQKLGLYKQAGLDIDFETGRGSAASAQKVGAGQSQLGLSDMAGVLLFRGKGLDAVGVMNVYANSPQGLYWLKRLGSDMGFLAWKDAGVNPYGNSIIANGDWLRANLDKVDKLVKITQKTFADCVKTPEPCINALVEANGALLYQNELENWHLVTMLTSDEISRTVALGWHDDARMADNYRLVDEYLRMEKPYDVKIAYTNEFLDKNVKMPPINPPKLY